MALSVEDTFIGEVVVAITYHHVELAEVDVGRNGHVGSVVYLIDIDSHPVEFLLVSHEESAINRLQEVRLLCIADAAEAPVVPLVIVDGVALGVAEGQFAAFLGRDAVTLQSAIGIDDVSAEGIRLCIAFFAQLLIPSYLITLLAVEDIAELTRSQPLSGVAFWSAGIVAVVSVQVVGVVEDRLIATSQRCAAVVATRHLDATRVPAVVERYTRRPSRESTILYTSRDVARVVAVVEDEPQVAAPVTSHKAGIVGRRAFERHLVANVLNGDGFFKSTSVDAPHEGCYVVTTRAFHRTAAVDDKVLDDSPSLQHAEEALFFLGAVEHHVFDAIALSVEGSCIASCVGANGDEGIITEVEILRQLGICPDIAKVVDLHHKPVVVHLRSNGIEAIFVGGEEVFLHRVTHGTEAPIAPRVIVALGSIGIGVNHPFLGSTVAVQLAIGIDDDTLFLEGHGHLVGADDLIPSRDIALPTVQQIAEFARGCLGLSGLNGTLVVLVAIEAAKIVAILDIAIVAADDVVVAQSQHVEAVCTDKAVANDVVVGIVVGPTYDAATSLAIGSIDGTKEGTILNGVGTVDILEAAADTAMSGITAIGVVDGDVADTVLDERTALPQSAYKAGS